VERNKPRPLTREEWRKADAELVAAASSGRPAPPELPVASECAALGCKRKTRELFCWQHRDMAIVRRNGKRSP